MKKHTRSILEELNEMSISKDRHHMVENTGVNLVHGVRNLFELINETYDEDTANDLMKRLINSMRTGDTSKFERGIRRSSPNKNARNKK